MSVYVKVERVRKEELDINLRIRTRLIDKSSLTGIPVGVSVGIPVGISVGIKVLRKVDESIYMVSLKI